MKKDEIVVGGRYIAKVGCAVTTVRVDRIESGPGAGGFSSSNRAQVRYHVTNLRTGRKTTFRSAAKFRSAAPAPKPTNVEEITGQNAAGEKGLKVEVVEDEQCSDPTPATTAAGAAPEPTTTSAGGVAEPRSTYTCEGGENGCWPDAGDAGEECRYCGGIIRAHNLEPSDIETALHREQVANRLRLEERAVAAGGKQCSDPTASSVAAPPARETVTGGEASFASSLAALRNARPRRGPTVAGMVPNEEQEGILAIAEEIDRAHACGRVLVVGAGAGTGKTATLKMLEQVLHGRGQYTAYNTSLVAESKAKFKKAACNTTHSLAFRAKGRDYQHRLNGERVKSWQVAVDMGLAEFVVTLDSTDERGDPRTKRLKADFLAGQVLVAVKRFCQSADRVIGPEHFGYIDGIDGMVTRPDGRQVRGRANNDRVREYLLPFAHRMWEDIARTDGVMPFTHDCYVKLWQLGTGNDRPVIAADYILLDEAQDTAPVFLDILKQQTHAMLVFVGDSNQAIYEWRGAVDAMKAYPDAPRRMLSQSYRFGQVVADVANAVLATLDEPTDLVMRGMPGLPSRVAEVAEPRCFLYRTNAGAVARVMISVRDGKKPHLIGGGADVAAWCQAAMDLQAGRGTRHPDLACFESWAEVQEYSKTDEGGDLKLMVKLVDTFGAEEIRDALKDMPSEEDADLVVSTAHKSKGREWDSVRLGPDFSLANRMSDPDRRLLYVAATRARLTLDVSECPPFCGGNEFPNVNGAGGGDWIPGLDICYTMPMPTEADQAAWRVMKNAPTSPPVVEQMAPPSPAATVAVTYTKLRSGEWGLRATSEVKPGQVVTVTTKANMSKNETVGRIVWSGNGVWLATVR